MKIDGSAFGQSVSSAASGGSQGGQSYDAQIKSLQKKREEYVKKLQTVKDETSDPEQAKQLAEAYQAAITGIDSRIAQLQQAKAEAAQSKAEKQQEKIAPPRNRLKAAKPPQRLKPVKPAKLSRHRVSKSRIPVKRRRKSAMLTTNSRSRKTRSFSG